MASPSPQSALPATKAIVRKLDNAHTQHMMELFQEFADELKRHIDNKVETRKLDIALKTELAELKRGSGLARGSSAVNPSLEHDGFMQPSYLQGSRHTKKSSATVVHDIEILPGAGEDKNGDGADESARGVSYFDEEDEGGSEEESEEGEAESEEGEADQEAGPSRKRGSKTSTRGRGRGGKQGGGKSRGGCSRKKARAG